MRNGLCSVFGNWKIKKLRRFANTIAQFTKALTIYRGFYKWKTMDDNKKKVCSAIWQLTQNFFIAYLPILLWCKTKRVSQSGVRLTVYCTRWCRKEISQDGDGQIFSKTLCTSLFNGDLSNEPNFGRIHLAGQVPLKFLEDITKLVETILKPI